MTNSVKRKKSLVAILLLLALCIPFALAGCAEQYSGGSGSRGMYEFKVTDHTTNFYVNDFSGIFTEEQKAGMMQKAIDLDSNRGGIQVVVTTVDTLEGCVVEHDEGMDPAQVDIEQVSYAMYKQYGIGQDDMGVLILFSTGDRRVRIETGYQMQTYITDSKSGQLLDNYGMEYFRNDQFAEGLISLQDAVISEINAVVPADWNVVVTEENVPEENAPEDVEPVIPVEDPTEVSKVTDVTENNNYGFYAAIIGIVSAFLAMIAGLIVSIKGKLDFKKKNEQAEKELEEQRNRYEQRIEDLRKAQREQTEIALSQKEQHYNEQLCRMSKEHERQVDLLQNQSMQKADEVRNLEVQNHALNQQISKLKRIIDGLEDKFSRMKTLHPDIDFEAEVETMIENEYKAKAEEIDAQLYKVSKTHAGRGNITVFKDALRTFENIPAEIMKYLQTDIHCVDQIKALLEESIALKNEYERMEQEKKDRSVAQKAYQEILRMSQDISIDCSYKNYDELKRACDIYDRLNHAAQGYFEDKALIQHIKALFREAEDDRNNRNAAKNAEREVHSIVDRIYTGQEGDREKLERAMKCYKSLIYAQQQHFDRTLLTRVKKLADEAEEDHRRKEARRRQEEEERRRKKQEEERQRREEQERHRRMMSSSHSSFGGHSGGFGGHGGRPSGGGASRRF